MDTEIALGMYDMLQSIATELKKANELKEEELRLYKIELRRYANIEE